MRRGLPLYADLLDKVRSLAVAHADETSWRHDGHSFWVWYAGNDDLALFRWDAHRSTEAAQELLGERFGLQQVLGGIVVMAGILLCRLSMPALTREPPPDKPAA